MLLWGQDARIIFTALLMEFTAPRVYAAQMRKGPKWRGISGLQIIIGHIEAGTLRHWIYGETKWASYCSGGEPPFAYGDFPLLFDLPFSSGTVSPSMFCRRSWFFTPVEPKVRAQCLIWAWWMCLGRAGEFCHIKLSKELLNWAMHSYPKWSCCRSLILALVFIPDSRQNRILAPPPASY